MIGNSLEHIPKQIWQNEFQPSVNKLRDFFICLYSVFIIYETKQSFYMSLVLLPTKRYLVKYQEQLM
jgi:hypothetical protein